MVDPHSESQASRPSPGQPPARDTASNLDRLLNAWGIEAPSDKVILDQRGAWRVRADPRDRIQAVDYLAWTNVPPAGLNRQEVATADLAQVTIASAGELRPRAGASIEFIPLVTSSERGGSLVDPSSGFSQLYQVEGGSGDFGSDIDLVRTTANFSYVFTPASLHRIVARSALGAVYIADEDRVNLAPSLRFFAGGSQSIRAYGYQSIGNESKVLREDGSRQTLVEGGDRLVTAALEYQYYFKPSWRGALFLDAGDAFDSSDFDLKLGPGFGIHYMSPVGAVRLEFANSVSDPDPAWRMVLNIGAEF
jgi:hypothetical protein